MASDTNWRLKHPGYMACKTKEWRENHPEEVAAYNEKRRLARLKRHREEMNMGKHAITITEINNARHSRAKSIKFYNLCQLSIEWQLRNLRIISLDEHPQTRKQIIDYHNRLLNEGFKL
jgi:hypothetical protein